MNLCRTALAALLLLPALACAAEPPVMFGGGPSRNMANPTAKNVPTDWDVAKTKNVKWMAELGSVSYGGPVIAGGRVFVGTNNDKPRNKKVEGDKGVLMCFEEATGKFLWQAVHDKLTNAEQDFPEQGIASTPCVDGDKVYYVSNRCELVCVTAKGKPDGTADVVWSLDMIKKLDVFPCQLAACSPLVVGKAVYVVTGNGADGAGKIVKPKAASFVAVNKDTGEVLWKSDLPGDKILDGQWSNPVYAEVGGKGQVIFPGGDGYLYSFEPDTGKLLWKFDCNPKSAEVGARGRAEAKNNIIATPVVADGKLYVGTGQAPANGNDIGIGRFWCVDLARGKDGADVSPVKDNFDPKAEVNKNSALVWQYGGPNPDEKSRRKMLFCRTVSTCSVHEGLVYITDMDGFLYCFDAATGAKVWDFDLKATIWGAPVVMDGKVYIGSENGNIFILKAGKQKPDALLATVDIQEAVKCSPVFANGVLYVQTDTRLYAVQEKR